MKLYWLDIETTGLNPFEDSILEVAIAEADISDPFAIGGIGCYVRRFELRPHHHFDPFVVGMHTKNGLWDECAASRLYLRDIKSALLDIVPWVENHSDRPTLAGSSVHFDHDFLNHHMPEVGKRFSHRHYDVSAVKLFCRSLGMEKIPKAEAHRATDDILESIAHARECAEWLTSIGRRSNA